MRDEWKFALMRHGELCQMMDGQLMMAKLSADSWVIVQQVSVIYIESLLMYVSEQSHILQECVPIQVLTLAKEVDQYIWTMQVAEDQRQGYLTVHMTAIHLKTHMLKMLGFNVNHVSTITIIKINNVTTTFV